MDWKELEELKEEKWDQIVRLNKRLDYSAVTILELAEIENNTELTVAEQIMELSIEEIDQLIKKLTRGMT